MINTQEIPKLVQEYRVEHRKQIPAYYNPILHILFSFTSLLTFTVFPLLLIKNPSIKDFLPVPIFLIGGNFMVYLIHRYPLHRDYRIFKYPYRAHTLLHHRFYIHNAMEPEQWLDYHMVLFPPIVVGSFCVIGAPLIGAIFAYFGGVNLGLVAGSMSAFYFLLYETTHYLYHVRLNHPIFKIKLLRTLRDHHTIHHDPTIMAEKNFNIVFPLFDFIFRTQLRKKDWKESNLIR